MLVACQVKVAVVGHIKDGILVAFAVVDDVQSAVVVQGIGDKDAGVARHTLVAVGAVQSQLYGRPGLLGQGPQTGVVAVGTGVQIVGAFVGRHGIGLSSQGELLVFLIHDDISAA